MKTHYAIALALAGALLTLVFDGCVHPKKLRQFTFIQNDTSSAAVPVPPESKIRPSDLLQISVSCQDLETYSLFNSNIALTGVGGGYLVDDSGFVKIPLLGKTKAAGFTKGQLADSITKRLVVKQYAISPVVTVRISNFRISVLGEVLRPGIIPVPNERITITEALAMAGDLTIYGNRENLLLMREKDGQRISVRFSLNDPGIFKSNIYYLQNEDVIYVEPMRAKAATLNRSTQVVSLILSTLSILGLIYTQTQLIK